MSALNNKVIVVTGAAKRIGRVIALRLAQEGARVVIHYNESEEEARKTLQHDEELEKRLQAERHAMAIQRGGTAS